MKPKSEKPNSQVESSSSPLKNWGMKIALPSCIHINICNGFLNTGEQLPFQPVDQTKCEQVMSAFQEQPAGTTAEVTIRAPGVSHTTLPKVQRTLL